MTASQLRARAREQMGNSIFAEKWLLVLAAGVIAAALLSITSFVSLIFVGAISIGLAVFCLRLVRYPNGPAHFEDLAFGILHDRFGHSLVTGLLVSLFTALWSLLFVIPGIVKSYSYAMTYYIAFDRPYLSANDCITESRRMMDGHKMRLFLLDLSFIGWYIVGALCLGIGTLWVDAYHRMARANFYEDLSARVASFDAGNNGGTAL